VTDLWCVSGGYIGYIEDGLLFFGETGECVGRAVGDLVFGRRGNYIGQILGDRIGFSDAFAAYRGDPPPTKTVGRRHLAAKAGTGSALQPFRHDR